MAVYLVDSNFFIQAHRAVYPLDVAVGFWTKVKWLAEQNHIFSIDKVKKEIFDHNDVLTQWCSANLPDNFFKDSADKMQEYAQISNWAYSRSNHYKRVALDEFLDADEADAFLAAFALSNRNNITIVTHEISRPEAKNKIKLPEPCLHFGIKFVNTIDMFRELKQTF